MMARDGGGNLASASGPHTHALAHTWASTHMLKQIHTHKEQKEKNISNVNVIIWPWCVVHAHWVSCRAVFRVG